jgi:hypothetical protein
VEKMKQWLIFIVKMAIGIAIVAWILMQVDQQKFTGYFLTMQGGDLFVILLLSLLSLWVQFLRWKYLLSQYSNSFEQRDLIPSFFAGFTFRLMIPGGHAELSKVFLLPGRKRGKIMAFGMERIFQTYLKVFLSLAFLPVFFPEYIWICTAIILIMLPGYIFFPKIPLLREYAEKETPYHRTFLMTTLFSLGVYVIMVLQYHILIVEQYRINVSATAFTVIYLWSAGVVPISISGLGIREGLAVYFFKFYGVPAAYALATSLFLFVINAILPALIGIPYIYRHRSSFKEIRASLQTSREILRSLRPDKRRQDRSRGESEMK